MVHFSHTLWLSVPIIMFFHPKKPPVSQAYLLFHSQNAIPFLIPSLPKTHFLLPLSNQELTFMLAFYRLVSINISDYFYFLRENILGWHQTSFLIPNLLSFSVRGNKCLVVNVWKSYFIWKWLSYSIDFQHLV